MMPPQLWGLFLKQDFYFLRLTQKPSKCSPRKQKAVEGMSGMTVTHAGGEAEINTTSGITSRSKATRSFVIEILILRKNVVAA